jgi:myb proto-oncogene protein
MASAKDRKRISWTEDMDKKLVEAVMHFGMSNWVRVAEQVGIDRKACRVRFMACFNTINRSEWTHEEDEALLDLFRQFGRKWTVISKQFPSSESKSR